MKPLDDKILVALVGLLCLTVLECIAMYMKLDGQLFLSVISGIVGIVSGVVGYTIGSHQKSELPEKDDMRS